MTTNARPLIRLPRRSYATLKALSKETKKPMSDLAAEAIERYSDDRFWDEVNRDFEAWTPQQWRAYRKEFKEWEALAGEALPPEVLADDWSAQLAAEAKSDARSDARSEAKSETKSETKSATKTGRHLVDRSRPRARTRAGRPPTGARRVG